MYKILIVDDEPYIVNGLHDLLADFKEAELDINCAFSASEAVNWLTKTKIDIVITDIQMPGMNGLELANKIKEWWPRTKIIFLTGYSNFDYIQTALRSEAVDFLLKTEGEEKIIETVRNAIRKCSEEMERKALIDKANQQLQLAIPTLQREFLMQLVQGDRFPPDNRVKKFTDLNIPLRPCLPCLLIVGRVDEGNEDYSTYEKALMQFAIQNIAEEFLSSTALFQPVFINSSDFYWFLQPKDQDAPEAWQRIFLFVKGTVESIQSNCKSLLKQSISFMVGSSAVEWDQVPVKYRELTRSLSRGLGFNHEMLMFESETAQEYEEGAGSKTEQWIPSPLGKTELLERLLDNGRQEECRQIILEAFREVPAQDADLFKETYYAIAIRLFSYLNRWRLHQTLRPSLRTELLLQYEKHSIGMDAVQFLLDVSAGIFEQRNNEQAERTDEIVVRLHQYIKDHLSGDVSLTRLGDLLSLNPSYLCRLYKQITGNSLSDFIAETKINKAKELLVQSAMKIHEIGRAVGFDSPAYFSRFFKKYTKVTPQEYRDGTLVNHGG